MALITKENAAEFQAKARIAFAKRRADMKAAAEIARLADEMKQYSEAAARSAARISDQGEEPVIDEYRQRQLDRVRAQLQKLNDITDELLEKGLKGDTDHQRLDRVTASVQRLYELQRQLSNTPLPPTIKAAEKKISRSGPAPGAFTPSPAPPSPTGE